MTERGAEAPRAEKAGDVEKITENSVRNQWKTGSSGAADFRGRGTGAEEEAGQAAGKG